MDLTGEFALIKKIKSTLGAPSKRTIVGIGDDAAIISPPKGHLVATVDMLVEGVHFDLSYTTPRELGHKALAVNLSDIAAMGATPLYGLVSLGLKQHVNEHFLIEFYEGVKHLARRFKVDIVGGNLVQSPTVVVVDMTVLGQVDDKYQTRGGARVGDRLAITNSLGRSAAGLNCLRRLGRHNLDPRDELAQAHLQPIPRVLEGKILKDTGSITSLIDVSDGLASELHHICAQSSVGALVEENLIPIDDAVHQAAAKLQADGKAWALYGGEDYELLCTMSPNSIAQVKRSLKPTGSTITVIGTVVPKENGIKLKRSSGARVPLEAKGWNHFVRRRNLT